MSDISRLISIKPYFKQTNKSHIYYFRAMAIMKQRLKGAQKGHSLLKKKADALTMRFRQILKKIIEVFIFHQDLIFMF